MERPRNRRPRRRRTSARTRRLRGVRGPRRCVPARALLVRGPPACGAQGRSLPFPRLPGRPRVPRVGPARAAAGAVARAMAHLGDRTRRHDAHALRGSRRGRLLLHRRRSRAADPEAEDLRRRCHAVGQRHCRASTDPARAAARRDALPRRGRAHDPRVLGRAGEVSRTRTPRCWWHSTSSPTPRPSSSHVGHARISTPGASNSTSSTIHGVSWQPFRTMRRISLKAWPPSGRRSTRSRICVAA